MATDFSKILGKKAADIEKPKPLPVGSYLVVNRAVPKLRDIGKNETPAAEFTLTCMAPQDDVDEDELAEFGGLEKVKGKELRHLMWLSEDAQYRAKVSLVEVFGQDEDGTLSEMISGTVGVQLIAKVSHRASDDGTELYAQVDSLAAA